MRRWLMAWVVVGWLVGVAAAQPGVRLAWRWDPGADRQYRLTERMVQRVSGEESESLEWTRVVRYRERVLEVDEDGVASVERAYEAVRVEVKTDAHGDVVYDSEDPATKEARSNPLVAPFAGLEGQRVRFRVSPDGDVTDVEGATQTWASMLEPLRGAGLGTALSGVSMASDAEALEREIKQGLAAIPGRSVRVRESWKNDVRHPTPIGEVRSEIEHTLKGFKRRRGERLARIVSTGRLESGDGDAGGAVQMLTRMLGVTIRLGDSEIEGETLFDDERGVVVHQEMTVRSSWEIDVGEESGLAELVGQSTQTIEQRSELELVD
ncbi:MAG: DUF6263 family protein [Phycisphaerales bacterium]